LTNNHRLDDHDAEHGDNDDEHDGGGEMMMIDDAMMNDDDADWLMMVVVIFPGMQVEASFQPLFITCRHRPGSTLAELFPTFLGM